MKRKIGKFLFPNMPRDLRRKKMNNLIFWFIVALSVGLIVVAGIFIENKR